MTLRQCCSAGLLLKLPRAPRAALLQLRHFKHLIGGSSIATRTTSPSPSASPPSLFKARCAVPGELLKGLGQQLSLLPPSQIFEKLDQRSTTTRRNMTTKAAAAAADQSESIVEDADHPESLQRLKPLLFALPRHYKMHLEPIINEKIVKGHGTISFEVVRKPPTSDSGRLVCYLNSESKTIIHSATIDNEPVQFETPKAKDNEDYSDVVVKYLIPQSKLPLVGGIGKRFDLEIKFDSLIRDDLEGQYLAKSSTEEGGDQMILTTQLESHFARRVFPCVDEPECKATYEFSFLVDEGLDVLHNTKLVSKSPVEGSSKILHTFEPTIKLSTYLLAYCVGNFEKFSKTIANVDGSDILVEVIGPRHTGKYFENTLDHACHALQELMVHFGQFPIDKVSHLALPDFSAGAMENMGLITYRDSILQFTKESSLRRQMFCILVITHELAHTWFGNLVTMKWWNDLWLNESFATCVEFVVAQKCYEKLKLDNKYGFLQMFVNEDKRGGMNLDSRENSHPISVEVKSPKDIESIFDAISYNKGSAILYMCIGYMGYDKFFEAVRNYLQKYKFQNAEANDLWRTMSDCSGLPVTEIMNYWIENQGFPCLEFAMAKGSNSKLVVKQHRYRDVHRLGVKKLSEDEVWPIPMHLEYTLANGKRVPVKFVFDEPEMTVDLMPTQGEDCKLESICVNKDAHGFFVYSLDDALDRITIKGFSKLNDIEKSEYISNLGWTMASSIESGSPQDITASQRYPKYTISNVLKILKELNIGKEDYSSRVAMHGILSRLIGIAKKCDSVTPGFYDKVLGIVKEIMSVYAIPTTAECLAVENYNERNATIDTLSFHVTFGTESVVQEMRELYEQRAKVPINDSFLSQVYKVISSDLNKQLTSSELSDEDLEKKIDEFMDAHLLECDSRTRGASLMGIGQGLKGKCARYFFAYGFSDRSRLQDLFYFCRAVSWPSQAQELLHYLNDTTEELAERIPFSSRLRVITDVGLCCTAEDLSIVEKLNDKSCKFCHDRILQETCDYIKANINAVKIFSKQLQ